jgi:hypothetical protein
VVTAEGTEAAGIGALAAGKSLALFAAAPVPGVPLGPAELLITPLLPVLRASWLVSSAFLQAATATSAAIAKIGGIFLTVSFITDLHFGLNRGSGRQTLR